MRELTERIGHLSPTQRDALLKQLAKQPPGNTPGRMERRGKHASTYPMPHIQQRLHRATRIDHHRLGSQFVGHQIGI